MNQFWNMVVGGVAVGSLAAASVAATPYKILPLGDSITAGTEFTSDGTGYSHGGYRPALYSMLNAAKPGGYDFVGGFAGKYRKLDGSTADETAPPAGSPDAAAFATYDNNHEGVPGAAIYDFTPGLFSSYASPYDVSSIVTAANPDAILLNLGTNDLQGFNLFGAYDPGDSPEDAIYSMKALLTRIFAAKPTVKVYLGGLIGLPAGVTKGDYTNSRAQDFNALLVSNVLPAFSAYDIQYVDLYNNAGLSRAANSPDFGAGDLHPSDQGYDKIAAAWYAAIPEPTSLSLLGVGVLLLGRRQRRA